MACELNPRGLISKQTGLPSRSEPLRHTRPCLCLIHFVLSCPTRCDVRYPRAARNGYFDMDLYQLNVLAFTIFSELSHQLNVLPITISSEQSHQLNGLPITISQNEVMISIQRYQTAVHSFGKESSRWITVGPIWRVHSSRIVVSTYTTADSQCKGEISLDIWRTVEHLRQEAQYKIRIATPVSIVMEWVHSQNGNLVWTESATCALETTYNALEKTALINII